MKSNFTPSVPTATSSSTSNPSAAATIANQDLLINPQTHLPVPIQSPQLDAFTPNPQPRRPRGFAAASSTNTTTAETNSIATGKGKREREKEKERTKLRERHRRAITSRMLAGLRQYGNFPLPARADMNDVLAALAREAGWTVDADGTTYRQSPPPSQMVPLPAVRSVESPISTSSHRSSFKASLDCQQRVPRIDESMSPASLDSVVITDRDSRTEKFAGASSINSAECLDADQLIEDVRSGEHENNFGGSQYVPCYVALANGYINNFCHLVDPQGVREELSYMKSLNIDGVVVDCWWGIVEAWSPQKYVWSGYRELFNIVREFKLKMQIVLAFHEYGTQSPGGVIFSLPQWVLDIGKENQDIFFTDCEGRRNTECLSWGIDKERVLKGRTGIEVYFDFMRSFRAEFDDLFAEGFISAIEIGLGASGELKYPSFPEKMGWRYPGIGEFQCYDKYLQQSLHKAAKLRGHTSWARGPDNAGHYNSRPHETGFFCDRGDYDSYYGRFFLRWYSQSLMDHADNILSIASLVFEDTKIVVKIPSGYWWYQTASHAAELTSGFYNPTNHDGYSPVFEVLKRHSATVKFACSGLQVSSHENLAGADLEGLSWQVLTTAWEQGLEVAGVNMLSCYDREGSMRVVDMAKPRNDPDHRCFAFFIYQQPTSLIQGTICFPELDYFVKCMHGEISSNLLPLQN